jgi:hypothetical protein
MTQSMKTEKPDNKNLIPYLDWPETGSWDGESLDPDQAPWNRCAAIELRESVFGTIPRWTTSVRVGWESRAMLVLFLCQDSYVWATKTKRDDALWEEEVVEVFLDPFGDLLSYFEFEVNPLNTVLDLVIRRARSGIQKNFTWQCAGLKTKTERTSDGWSAAFRIPFASLGDCHPKKNVWRANFLRIERPQHEGRELSAWSPTFVSSFHVPERFGLLQQLS